MEPQRKTAPVEAVFVSARTKNTKGCVINWRDNPKFPAKLERDRQRDLAERPEQYGHIWEGDYMVVNEGAYWAKDLVLAKEQGRIGRVAADPLMTIRIFCDIGGTGARADAFTMWAAQFIGKEIRVLNHYEAVGQPAATHVGWLQGAGPRPTRRKSGSPHDGDTQDKVNDVSYASFCEGRATRSRSSRIRAGRGKDAR